MASAASKRVLHLLEHLRRPLQTPAAYVCDLNDQISSTKFNISLRIAMLAALYVSTKGALKLWQQLCEGDFDTC
jgi:hypothetical protein